MEKKYSHLKIFHEPKCLIESAEGSLSLNKDVLKQLSEVDDQVNVVAVVGLYRTGKSYLMNRLMGRNKGFPLGSTIEAKTKGIWVWCRPHPIHKDQVLMLLDTEGLGDANKGDQNHDNWIFALATLLSSTLVYNMFGVFDHTTLDKLNFITEISKHIKTKDSERPQEDNNFDYYFPLFVLVMRDFYLELSINGKPVTEDEYLEWCLEYKQGASEEDARYNEPRRCIRRYFNERKCFTFDQPTLDTELLKKLEQVTEDDLISSFKKDSDKFVQFVLSSCPPKKVDTGNAINGRALGCLADHYIKCIHNGDIPCMENALKAMAMIENSKCVEMAVDCYRRLMRQRLRLPVDLQILLREHLACTKEAIALFLKKAIKDEGQTYQGKANETILFEFEDLRMQNEAASKREWQNLLEVLNRDIKSKTNRGCYARPGGYVQFDRDLTSLRQRFEQSPNLGPMAKDVLDKFWEDKQKQAEVVRMADKELTEDERQLQRQREEVAALKRETDGMKRAREAAKEQLYALRTQFRENISQLRETRVNEDKHIEKHFEKVEESRVEELRKTVDQGFQNERETLQKRIDNLKEERKKVVEERREDTRRAETEEGGIWNGIKKFASGIVEGVKAVGEAVFEGVKAVGGAVISGAKKLFNFIFG